MMKMQVFSPEKLRNLRKENHFTQFHLAEEIDISNRTIRYWEKGERLPKVDNFVLLLKIFNVPIDALLTDKNL